jgi:hypothetical protein
MLSGGLQLHIFLLSLSLSMYIYFLLRPVGLLQFPVGESQCWGTSFLPKQFFRIDKKWGKLVCSQQCPQFNL